MVKLPPGCCSQCSLQEVEHFKMQLTAAAENDTFRRGTHNLHRSVWRAFVIFFVTAIAKSLFFTSQPHLMLQMRQRVVGALCN